MWHVSDRASFDLWLTENRTLNEEEANALIVLSSLLGQLFRYFSDGYQMGPEHSRTRVIGMRSWIVLYSLRPDLVRGESMGDAARKFGVTKVAMKAQLDKFREYFPALKFETASRRGEGDREVFSNRMRRARAGLPSTSGKAA